MPMKSQAQRAYLWSHHPTIARRFENETRKGKRLPKHVRKAK
jgi:hypothetical protein